MSSKLNHVNPFGGSKHVIWPVMAVELRLQRYRPATPNQLNECMELAIEWTLKRSSLDADEREALESIAAQLFAQEAADVRSKLRLTGRHGVYGERELLCALAYWNLETVAAGYLENQIADVLWGLSSVHAALHELQELDRASLASDRARRAATGLHVRHRGYKAEALDYYTAHKAEFTSKNDAADAIAGAVVPLSYETVRKWLRGA